MGAGAEFSIHDDVTICYEQVRKMPNQVYALLFSVAWPGGGRVVWGIGVCGFGFALEWSFVAFGK